ncbi:basement membrane-specific heparan sulfate proteoglycan core protein, partial [Exaiptasia diaphana]|uniref:Ig-like domain-containing protein n=1 Tax=Exaiptasia diaphana TaxID=2652724 RepID=A0A913Y4C2_EXADI
FVSARPEDPITVSVSPKNLHISSGQTARFICKANSQTYYTLKWTKGESDKLPDGAVDKDGILTIESVKRMHTGTYTCTGSNQNSFDQVTVQLKVAAIITPQVSILPRFLTVNEGDNVFFRCRATGLPPPDLIWIGGPEGKLPDDVRLSKGNSVFEIFRVKKKHEGEYYCVARNDGAVGRMRTVLNVRAVGSAPIVQVSPKSLDVMEGEAAELQCTASGDPPPTFTWSRVEGDIPESSTKIDGVLRIDSLSINDSGTYVCTAANRFGAVAENAVVTVEKDSSTPPSASVNPDEITLKEGQTATITCEKLTIILQF